MPEPRRKIEVEIMVPGVSTPESLVWHKLKYGTSMTLELGVKINRLAFLEDNVVLHGILPYEAEHTMQEGCIYKCKIDYYEEYEE